MASPPRMPFSPGWAEDSADAEAGPLGTDPVAEAIEESGHDPLAATTAAAEADPWTDPSAPGNR